MELSLMEKYEGILSELETVQAERELVINKALEPVRAEVTNLDVQITDLTNYLESIKEQIKEEVLKLGETLHGTNWMATWNKGRETWDGKALDGYAMAHPEVLQAKKVGSPTVSFRPRK